MNSLLEKEDLSNRDIISAIISSNKFTFQKLNRWEQSKHLDSPQTDWWCQPQTKFDGRKSSDFWANKIGMPSTNHWLQIFSKRHRVERSLSSMFKVAMSSISFVSSFINKTHKQSNMVVTNVHFTNTFDKGKLPAAKMAMGSLNASRLFPQAEEI